MVSVIPFLWNLSLVLSTTPSACNSIASPFLEINWCSGKMSWSPSSILGPTTFRHRIAWYPWLLSFEIPPWSCRLSPVPVVPSPVLSWGQTGVPGECRDLDDFTQLCPVGGWQRTGLQFRGKVRLVALASGSALRQDSSRVLGKTWGANETHFRTFPSRLWVQRRKRHVSAEADFAAVVLVDDCPKIMMKRGLNLILPSRAKTTNSTFGEFRGDLARTLSRYRLADDGKVSRCSAFCVILLQGYRARSRRFAFSFVHTRVRV